MHALCLAETTLTIMLRTRPIRIDHGGHRTTVPTSLPQKEYQQQRLIKLLPYGMIYVCDGKIFKNCWLAWKSRFAKYLTRPRMESKLER